VPGMRASRVQVYLDLRARIHRREDGHRPGDRLPNREVLADLYGVSVYTIGRAIDLLKHDGLVETHGGAGTWVVGGEEFPSDHF